MRSPATGPDGTPGMAAPPGLAALIARYFRVSPAAGLYHVIRCLGFPRLAAVERALPKEGDILDAGCGYGLLSVLAAARAPRRRVVGIDRLASRLAVGERVARRLGLANLRLESGRIEALPPGPFDAIVIVDVLLYRPLAGQAAVIRACRERLRPGGRLLIKEQMREPSWKARCVDLQERLVVGFKTGKDRGGPWAEMAPSGTHLWTSDGVMALLRDSGLLATIEPLHAGCYLSHHLVIGVAPRRPAPAARTSVAARDPAAAEDPAAAAQSPAA